MRFRELRFSLKWLMIAVTACSVIFYLCVRPTIVAHQFAADIKEGKLSQLVNMAAGSSWTMLEDLQSWHKDLTFENCKVSAEVAPITWRDMYKFRRKITLNIELPATIVKTPNALNNFLVAHLAHVSWGDEP